MNLKTVRYEIADPKVSKELSGFRIALFSDVHNSFYGEDQEHIIPVIESLSPDIVVFAGDAVNKIRYDTETTEGLDNACRLFSALGKAFPVYYVSGNHDKRFEQLCKAGDPFADCYFKGKALKAAARMDPSPFDTYGDYLKTISEAGVCILSNTHVNLAGGALRLTGLDLPLMYYRHRCDRPGADLLKELIREPDPAAMNILVTHTPRFFREYSQWGANLTLCGHMHGGIIRLPLIGGVFSPYRTLFPKYCYGKYRIGDKKMIVSSGCSLGLFRERLTNPPEIVLITLKNEV